MKHDEQLDIFLMYVSHACLGYLFTPATLFNHNAMKFTLSHCSGEESTWLTLAKLICECVYLHVYIYNNISVR